MSAGRMNLCAAHNTPSTNLVVRVAGEQSLPVRAPRQTHTLGLTALLADLHVLRLELIDLALLLEVEDDDAARGCGTQPVSVGREHEGMDFVSCLERVEMLRLVQVPEHGGAVLATGSAEGAVRGDSDSIDVASVANVVGLDAA